MSDMSNYRPSELLKDIPLGGASEPAPADSQNPPQKKIKALKTHKCQNEACERKTVGEFCSICKVKQARKYHLCACGKHQTADEKCFKCTQEEKRKQKVKPKSPLETFSEIIKSNILGSLQDDQKEFVTFDDKKIEKKFNELQIQN